jgi:sugar phosphate isomerase/epimerase
VNADQIAIQLYTLRRLIGRDLPATINRVADIGYRAVEFAGLEGCNATTARAALDAAGVRVIGAHVPFQALQQGLAAELDQLETLGCRRVVVPWVDPALRASASDVNQLARRLNDLADECSERGFKLAYHNHAYEFERIDATTIWDILVPRLQSGIELEIDVYWATHAGRDAVRLIQGEAGRVRLIHMKDMARGRLGEDLPPGDGTLPWAQIVQAGRVAGVEWYIVEQDSPLDPIESAARGFRFLQQLVTLMEPS